MLPPRATISNAAKQPREQWVEVQVPGAFDLPGGPVQFGPQAIGWATPQTAAHSRSLFLRKLWTPGQHVVELVPRDPNTHGWEFRASPWVLDRPDSVLAHLLVLRRSGLTRVPLYPRQLEANPARRVYHARVRVPDSMLVVDLIDYLYHEQDVGHYEIGITCSDPRTAAQTEEILGLAIECGELHTVWWSQRMGGLPAPVRIGENWVTTLLRERLVLGDRQQLWFFGSVLYAPQSIPNPVLDPHWEQRQHNFRAEIEQPLRWGVLSAADWQGKWGPYGLVPAQPTDGGSAADLAEQWAGFLKWPGHIMDLRPLGLLKQPEGTGGQEDFGSTKGAAVVAGGEPLLIDRLVFCALQEGLRPYHLREEDGSPFTHAAHPEAVFWFQAPHFHCVVGPYRHGKPCPEPSFETHGWGGKDRQHFSMNGLLAALSLTGSHALRMLVDDNIETFLCEDTVPSERPGWSTNGMDAPRAQRVTQAMAWAYQLSGREDLRLRMLNRLHEVVGQQWLGRKFLEDPARPVRWMGAVFTEDRVLMVDGKAVPAAVTWNEALGVMGLHAGWRVHGDPLYRSIAKTVATTILNHGIFQQDGRWHLASPVYYPEGEDEGKPLPAEMLRRDSKWLQLADGTDGRDDFRHWVAPALIVLLGYQREDGEDTTRVEDVLRSWGMHPSHRAWSWEAAEWLGIQ